MKAMHPCILFPPFGVSRLRAVEGLANNLTSAASWLASRKLDASALFTAKDGIVPMPHCREPRAWHHCGWHTANPTSSRHTCLEPLVARAGIYRLLLRQLPVCQVAALSEPWPNLVRGDEELFETSNVRPDPPRDRQRLIRIGASGNSFATFNEDRLFILLFWLEVANRATARVLETPEVQNRSRARYLPTYRQYEDAF